MPISKYLKALRQRVGHDLLLVPAVAAIVPNADGHILVQKRAEDGQWSLPAGAIDPDETPAQAIVREVWEETGLNVSVERVVGTFGGHEYTSVYPNGDACQYTITVFLCRIDSGTLGGQDEETAELRFVPPHLVPDFGIRFPAELFRLSTPAVMFN